MIVKETASALPTSGHLLMSIFLTTVLKLLKKFSPHSLFSSQIKKWNEKISMAPWIKSSAKTRGTPWMKETGRVGGNSLCSNANVRLPWLSTGKVLGAPRLLSAQEHDQMSIVYAAVQRSPDSGRWGSVQGHRVWTRQSPGQCVSEASPSSHLQVSKRRSRERLGEIIFRPMADHGGERKSNHMMNFTIVGKSDPHQWHEGDCKIWGIILAGSI